MPKIDLKGYFAWKDSMKVSAATVTTGWVAGQLFKVSAGSGDDYSTDEVALQTTAGGLVYGVALESSTEATNVTGRVSPSSSRVTLLHGHSKFEINHKAEVLASDSTRCYAADVLTADQGTLLYCDAAGKWTTTPNAISGSMVPGAITTGPALILPVGFVTKVPILANNYTLGVVLFG